MDRVPYIELECEAIEICCWQQNFCPELYHWYSVTNVGMENWNFFAVIRTKMVLLAFLIILST